MADKSLVSVILTAWNEAEYLQESIDSVLSQTWEKLQLIVVDDGSTDGTPERIRSCRDPRLEAVFLSENGHIAHATNAGMARVKGDYVAIMDAADLWVPEKLERQLAYLAENPAHAACFTWADVIDETGADANERFGWYKDLFACHTDTREEWLRYFFYHGNRLNNPSSLVKTEAARAVGAHHPFYIQGQDMQWWVRFTKRYSFGVIEEPLVKLRRKAEDQARISSTTEANSARFYNECMLIRSHFFEDLEDDLLIRAFGADFIRKDAASPEELEIEKAFLLCSGWNNADTPCAIGIQRLEQLMGEERYARLLREKYGFGTHGAGKLSGQHLYNDDRLQHYAKKYPELEAAFLEISKAAEERLQLIREFERINKAYEELTAAKDAEISRLAAEGNEKDARLREMEAENARLREMEAENARLREKEAENARLAEAIREIVQAPAWKKNAVIRKYADLLE